MKLFALPLSLKSWVSSTDESPAMFSLLSTISRSVIYMGSLFPALYRFFAGVEAIFFGKSGVGSFISWSPTILT